jgi:hypothetical protein
VLSRDELKRVLEHGGRADGAVTTAIDVLRSAAADATFPLSIVETDDMLRIYRRRLERPGFDLGRVEGADRLISDLETATGQRIAMVLLTRPPDLITIWTDPQGQRLIACVRGSDARY